ncbi:SDR family oxidoreductase [Reyranella sp.]|uniref:SDR family oxidoreductase n=1 Tax=Reyranella sp. TaxID=1929291 RepID=UPI000BD9B59A|nr:SDR family oxidoreductase [Reyranella sp.]OYY37652.1 MAG: short-chain dehydrogenase [Rhodospirillales bacterium 35-66-84]OYZ92696.1 MAG: short-chain dehydrogenase [Rhodospirillales bacterium 24-66-33]OZB24059.1 MAG: short-chain dehydrogenase [Rhodospirillales bacterium 39-66-50]HQS17415.1 SDR family oxidoreductase [Reyranella sp.]HQT13858.1 SDR family oxidoreductase [Reyranella sp.]
MKIKDSVALVTGANRGLGLAFTQALLAGGVRKVYAAARDPASVKQAGVVPVRLDVTNAEQVAAAAAELGDVTLVINNAGIIRGSGFLGENGVEAVRAELETNFFGPVHVSRAFAPILARNGGGAIVNVLSALSWVAFPGSSTYSASKAAAWSFSNGLRNELRGQGTQVLALHVGYMDTDMVRDVAAPKSKPEDVARQTLDALEAGQSEILADEVSRRVKQSLSAEPGVYLVPPAG